MAREDAHFRLRIPDSLKEKVEKAALANHRSMTAEIIARLERTFEFKGYVETMDKDWVKDFLKHTIDKAAQEILNEAKESGQPIDGKAKKG